MAGGSWNIQNKVLPGVYVNLVGQGKDLENASVRGVVGLAISLSWLPEQTILSVNREDATAYFDNLGAAALPLREAAKEASRVLLYRLNKGIAASGTVGGIACTANCTGTFGNSIKVSVQAVPGESGSYYVLTYHNFDEWDRQKVTSIDKLVCNDWVTFSGTGALSAAAATALSGGTDGTATNADYSAFLAAMEVQEFNAVACVCDTPEVKALFVAWAKRLINEEGRYIQVVAPTISADFEGVISVANGVFLADGTHIDKVTATAYVAGATAGIPLEQGSLTNHAYLGAVDVDTRYTLAEQQDFAKTGQMIFIPATGSQKVTIQKDINTLTTQTEKRPYAFSKNRIVRILYALSAECVRIGMLRYVGKMSNNPAGRNLYKGEILGYLRQLELQGAANSVTPEDVQIAPGTDPDAVLVTVAIRPTDTMDVLYITVRVAA